MGNLAGSSEIYRVNSIYPTIQGEGVMAGTPVILVRLQGCNLRCSFCDTKETWRMRDGYLMTSRMILERCTELQQGHKWILLTGGEPLLQPIKELVSTLRTRFFVALETNGALPLRDAHPNWITLSPKLDQAGWINQETMAAAGEFKFVIRNQEDIDRIDTLALGERIILLQPESQDAEATNLCIKAVQERGWRLSLQLHKYLKIE